MKLKKLFAMLMALAMVAGLLAACSNDTGNASTPRPASLCPTLRPLSLMLPSLRPPLWTRSP